MCPKPLRIRFDKINGFIRIRCGEFRYLVLFNDGSFHKVCDKIKYFIGEKSDIRYSISHNFGKIRIGSYNSLPIEKILVLHNDNTC